MARIRSVHPGIWTDENFVEMSAQSRLFLIGLWNEADDFGVLEWRPSRLKMRLAPADDINVEAVLSEIVAAGFLVKVERAGAVYGVVRDFRKHQRPKNPSAPTIEMDAQLLSIVGLPATASEVLPQPYPSTSEISLQMEGGKEGNRKGEKERGGEKYTRVAPTPVNFPDQVPANLAEAAQTAGLTPDGTQRQWARFANHHRAHGAKLKDIGPAWSNWIEESRVEDRVPPAPTVVASTTTFISTDDARWAELAEQWRRAKGRSPPVVGDGWHFPNPMIAQVAPPPTP